MCACVFPLYCPQVSAYCVYMFRCVSLQVLCCAWVCVRDNLPLTYVPSFVSEDYSFPFEVRLLAQRGRSERRPRAGFHTFPTAACRLGGKYVCRPQRQGERVRERQGKWKGTRESKRRRVIDVGRKQIQEWGNTWK